MKKLNLTTTAAILLACSLVPVIGQDTKPAPPKPQPELKWDKMDLAPFFSGTIKAKDHASLKGIVIQVGTTEEPATVCFDTELMRMHAGWTGGFIRFPRGRGGLEGNITPELGAEGALKFWTTLTPGWMKEGAAGDPRIDQQGPLPRDWAQYRGLYVHGGKVVLSYTVSGTPVLELPGYETRAGAKVFTRTIQIEKTSTPTTLVVCDMGSTNASVVPAANPVGGKPSAPAEGHVAILTSENKDTPGASQDTVVGVIAAPKGATFEIDSASLLKLKLPALSAPAAFQVVIWTGIKSEFPKFTEVLDPAGVKLDLAALTKGGPARWSAPMETAAKLGTGDGPYVSDEITLPDENPFHSWFRPGGHDFFPDGSMALANLSGDVWLVSGLDDKLEHVKWKRFANGLFQPLGCKVVEGKIYILGRDQITRLHDLNNDGEADFYESFNNDCVVTDNYHEFALDLQTDSKGNFYYAKGSPWTPTIKSPHQGCLLKVSKDGSKLEVFATGLRAPNGMGMGPGDEITVSDNQGHWMPANRLNLVKQGGFYGMTPAAHRVLPFRAADGSEFKANPSEEAARKEFKTAFWGDSKSPVPTAGHDAPLCWVPMSIDNSSGGQVWVPPGDKWGPLGGQMLFLSYGKCALFSVLQEKVDGGVQGGLARFPFKFSSGVHRARFSPKDGQLYLTGLNVWQSDASKFGCLYRVRYTGEAAAIPVKLRTSKDGVELTFSAALDEKSATDPQNFSVERWNYRWSGNYGSDYYSVLDPTRHGKSLGDLVLIDKIQLSPDKKTLSLLLPEMGRVMQMKIKFKIQSADGKAVDQEINHTINQLPGEKVAVAQ